METEKETRILIDRGVAKISDLVNPSESGMIFPSKEEISDEDDLNSYLYCNFIAIPLGKELYYPYSHHYPGDSGIDLVYSTDKGKLIFIELKRNASWGSEKTFQETFKHLHDVFDVPLSGLIENSKQRLNSIDKIYQSVDRDRIFRSIHENLSSYATRLTRDYWMEGNIVAGVMIGQSKSRNRLEKWFPTYENLNLALFDIEISVATHEPPVNCFITLKSMWSRQFRNFDENDVNKIRELAVKYLPKSEGPEPPPEPPPDIKSIIDSIEKDLSLQHLKRFCEWGKEKGLLFSPGTSDKSRSIRLQFRIQKVPRTIVRLFVDGRIEVPGNLFNQTKKDHFPREYVYEYFQDIQKTFGNLYRSQESRTLVFEKGVFLSNPKNVDSLIEVANSFIQKINKFFKKKLP